MKQYMREENTGDMIKIEEQWTNRKTNMNWGNRESEKSQIKYKMKMVKTTI